MHFGEKLKQLRNARALSQPELAESAQIEQSYLSKLENGRSSPSSDVLSKLIEALDVSIDELLDGIDDADTLSRLSANPQIGTHIQLTQAARIRSRNNWLLGSLVLASLGLAIIFAGMGALIFPDVNFDYEYVSTDLVPKGNNGQVYDSLDAYVRYVEGEKLRTQAPVTDSFENRVYRERQKLGVLELSIYLLEDEFLGINFHRDASDSELAILQAAGFDNGGSRLFEISERHTLHAPENGYLLFLGWIMIALGATGLLYTLIGMKMPR